MLAGYVYVSIINKSKNSISICWRLLEVTKRFSVRYMSVTWCPNGPQAVCNATRTASCCSKVLFWFANASRITGRWGSDCVVGNFDKWSIYFTSFMFSVFKLLSHIPMLIVNLFLNNINACFLE